MYLKKLKNPKQTNKNNNPKMMFTFSPECKKTPKPLLTQVIFSAPAWNMKLLQPTE